MGLEEEICSLTSYEAIENILTCDKLISLQAVDVLKMLYRKSSIVMYDTGMGKTYLAAAVIAMLRNEDPSRKFIMLVKKGQLIQTPKKLEKNIGVSVLATGADAKSLQKNFYSGAYKNYDVFMITHDCLENRKFMGELFKVRKEYSGLIIDEAHNLNNFIAASSASMLRGMCNSFEYRYALTATPITSDVAQAARLAYMLDSETYPDPKKLFYDLRSGRFSIEEDPCFFISRSRADFGIVSDVRGYPYFVDAQANQVNASGADMFVVCKGEGAVNQAKALVQFIKERPGQKGLVFINQHAIRNWVTPFLDKAGIRYDCINGYTSKEDKERIMTQFNELDELDVVITSVTEAIDLDCNWVMFYEFTLNIAQMIGRAYRGLYDKVLEVYFMFTKDTGEFNYFMDKIYARSELIRKVIGKSYTAVFDVKNKGSLEL